MRYIRSNPNRNELLQVKTDLESTLRQLDTLIEKSQATVQTQSPSSQVPQSNVDLFAEASRDQYTTEDATQIVAWLRQNYSDVLQLYIAESTIAAVCMLSLDPYIRRLYRAIKDEILEGIIDIDIGSQYLSDAIASLEFAVFLRNSTQVSTWTFYYPDTGSPRVPNKIDDVNPKASPGRVDRTILPSIELDGRAVLRGLVTQQAR